MGCKDICFSVLILTKMRKYQVEELLHYYKLQIDMATVSHDVAQRWLHREVSHKTREVKREDCA